MPDTQARRNYAAYRDRYQEALEREHPAGHVALLHDQELIEVYEDVDKAYQAGLEQYGPGNFSLQEIGEKPVDLGILAAALL